MRTHYKWIILLVGLTICLRLPAILHPKGIDAERLYAVVANELLHGGTLYRSAVERKPPLLFWIYKAIFWVVGPYNWLPFHLVAVAWILLTMWGLYAIGGALFTPNVGLIAALLYSIGATPSYHNLALNGEIMMNLPIVWALFLAFKPQVSRWGWAFVVSGVLLCCAFLIKQPAAVAAIPVGLYVLLPSYRATRHLRMQDSVRHATLLTTSYFLTLGIFALVLHHQGILGEAYYWTIGDHDVPHGPTDAYFWYLALTHSLGFALAWHPLVLVCVLAVWECCTRGGRYWASRPAEYSALLLLVGCSFVGVSASGRFYTHYYNQLLPSLALLGAPVLTAIWTHTYSYRFLLLRPRTLQLLLGSTAAVFLLLNTVELWKRSPEKELSRYVRDHSTPDDTVFFWGKEAGLYAEARRRPASRYIHTFPLTGYIFGSPTRYDPDYDTTDRILPGAWDILQEEFRQALPLFFVDTTTGSDTYRKYPPSRYPFLKRLLAQHYEVVYSYPKRGVIYRRIDRLPTGEPR